MTPEVTAERGAGAELGLRVEEDLEGLPEHLAGIGARPALCAKPGKDRRQVDQVDPDLSLRVRVRRYTTRVGDPVTRLPDFQAAEEQRLGLVGLGRD